MDDYQLVPDDDEAPEEWLAHLDAEAIGQGTLDEIDAVDDHAEANGSP